MHYPESVEYLYKLGNEIRSAKFGLDGIRALVEELGNPQRAFRTVHVAGTNGKGSTCAMIDAGLRAAGLRTGLYTSPHLVEPAERIRVDGAPVTPQEFAAAFDQVHAANERLLARERLQHHTTYFETVTAMAFVLFRERNVEIAVIEVGLGGRLDATNVVEPELTVITRIDFDHEQFLGSSLPAIAGEKAGILKSRVPVVVPPQRPEAMAVIEERAAELHVPVHRATALNVEGDAHGSTFTTHTGHRIRCPLAGVHQAENAAAAVEALRSLGYAPEISGARWPGRLQRIADRPEIILDGAHNPSGARALAEHIRRFYSSREVHIVFGAMRDKSVHEMAEILFPLASRIILAAPANPRAVRPEALLDVAPAATVAPSVAEALRMARSAPPHAAVFITGSLYLVGEVLRDLVE